MRKICINMHKNACWEPRRHLGVPPDTLGHAKGHPGGFLIDFESFWGPFLEPFGDPWASVGRYLGVKMDSWALFFRMFFSIRFSIRIFNDF